MPKKLIKKYAPNPEKIRQIKGIGFLAKWIANPNLWHVHRHNTAKAFASGLFWMSIPIPSQMLTSAITAIIFRANLPISVALVWISNPLTMPPIFYFNYLVGTWILGDKAQSSEAFDLSFDGILHTLDQIWLPLYLGSTVVGVTLAVFSYFGIHIFWRWHVAKSWKIRRQERRKNQEQ
ncbi:DUF2062 domain-containing protein [Hydrogenovibrio marinus]|uniref:ATP-binding protein n=1 Tax=Hydrogenovibrio marinus TaxID=28885 RepID=A0A066ZN60_HYDMR|nr:DUF2062 domain-containing protein [Hydrogenovibrio marinus]KDN94967.1 ATP-binding protein [Hydrogenovibrio marinus]BBN59432.1 hypothetical protein HVMH_1026 [Hydrogenovibrio marinus]